MLILTMLEAAMCSGTQWERRDRVVELLMEDPTTVVPTDKEMQEQVERTAAL